MMTATPFGVCQRTRTGRIDQRTCVWRGWSRGDPSRPSKDVHLSSVARWAFATPPLENDRGDHPVHTTTATSPSRAQHQHTNTIHTQTPSISPPAHAHRRPHVRIAPPQRRIRRPRRQRPPQRRRRHRHPDPHHGALALPISPRARPPRRRTLLPRADTPVLPLRNRRPAPHGVRKPVRDRKRLPETVQLAIVLGVVHLVAKIQLAQFEKRRGGQERV